MLLLPIQMYGQQQGLGTTDSNKILSEFGKSAYKMMTEQMPTVRNLNANITNKDAQFLQGLGQGLTTSPVNPTNKDIEFLQKNMDAFDRNPYGFDLDPSGQFYIDNTGAPIDRDTYNYLYQDYLNQQNEAQKDMNPDKFGLGGLLDKLQFYKR